MKKKVILSGIIGSFLLFGALVCHAENWDKNNYQNKTIETAFYDADSIKVQDKAVNWTEKYLFTNDGSILTSKGISKYEVCKQNISKKGSVTQLHADYQIEKDKIRLVAKRYYNKANEMLCTDKDMGKDFNSSWSKIVRGSPMEKAQYDLVTKYKVKFPN